MATLAWMRDCAVRAFAVLAKACEIRFVHHKPVSKRFVWQRRFPD